MGHSYTGVGGLGDFTVTKSNPTGTTVRFTISDAANKLTTSKMLRAVVCDAIDQFITIERADLDTNGDTDVKGSGEYTGVGDGFSAFNFNYGSKYAEVELTALTNIVATGDLTASIPYADVA
jgi:hypothetical protein